ILIEFCTCIVDRIMPPRRLRKKSVKKLVERHVAKDIKEYEKTRADSINAGGSGSAPPAEGRGYVRNLPKCNRYTFTTMGNALQSVRSAKELVIGRKTADLGFQVQELPPAGCDL
nr:hypothetical protein [Tanacetum cinerariifolium]